jgi:hypothetical protein
MTSRGNSAAPTKVGTPLSNPGTAGGTQMGNTNSTKQQLIKITEMVQFRSKVNSSKTYNFILRSFYEK